MGKHLKRIISILILGIFLFLLVSCGEAKSYIVEFYSEDTKLASFEVSSGKTVEAYEIENGDHDLVAWHIGNLDGAQYSFASPVNSNLVLVAEWTGTITLRNGDNSVLEKIEVAKGEAFEPSKMPTKKEDGIHLYVFKGWDHELVGTGEDLNIRPIFEEGALIRTVTFYDKDGKVYTIVNVQNGEKLANAIDYKIEDDNYYTYELVGWETKNGKSFDFDTEVISDMSLYPSTKRTPLPIDFTGKVFSMIGDSVSTFYKSGDPLCSYYGGENQFYYPYICPRIEEGKQTYWGQLILKLGLKLGINESYSGTRCTGSGNTAACSDYRINHLDDNGTPDIIYIFIGINDNVAGVSTNEYRSGFDTMLKKISTLYPNAYVFCALHPYSNYHNVESHKSYSETARLNYNQTIIDLVEKYQYGLIHLDEAQTKDNYVTLQNDNLHPNQAGHDAWYSQCLHDILDYFNQTKEDSSIDYVLEEGASLPQGFVNSFKEGTVFELPTPVKEGYLFNGWYYESDYNGYAVTETIGIKNNDKLYAEFIKDPGAGKMYAYYIYNGGVRVGYTIENNITYETTTSRVLNLPEATREGYTFGGWYDNPDFTGSKILTIKTSTKLFAKWIKNNE